MRKYVAYGKLTGVSTDTRSLGVLLLRNACNGVISYH